MILLLVAVLVVFYLKSETNSKKILLKQEDTQEKINTLSADIQSRKEYLCYLPESAQRLNFFKKFTEQLTQLQELENIYAFLGEEIKNIFQDLSVFLLYVIERDRLRLVSSYRQTSSTSIKHKEGDVLDYWALRHNQGLLIEDISQDFRFDLEQIRSSQERVINSLILNPMSLGNKVIGLLRVESKEKSCFDFEDLRILSVIADLASVAIDKAKALKRVQELAIKDGMTGLYLRGYFLERLKEEMQRALITENSLGIILADVDFFKRLNDEFGHTIGDLVLRRLADVIKEVVGDAGNVISRFGGEEFIILLASSSKEQTRTLAEELRRKVEKASVSFRRNKINFTISSGVAAFPDDSKFLEELIKKADDALYKAKSKGRNNVCLARP